MRAHDPRVLAADCGGEWHGLPIAPITGFGIDSRVIAPGELFIALSTGQRDGHDFLADAAARGASAALVSHFVSGTPLPQLVVPDTLTALHALGGAHRARFNRPVVAITGSAGKTSTKDLLAVLLSSRRDVLATSGNLNNHLGVPLTLLGIEPGRHRAAVIEAGISGPGEMDAVAALIAPDVAVVTMVAAAHLHGLGTVEGVAREKARLAAHLRDGGMAVFPASCLAFEAFRSLDVPVIVAAPASATVAGLPPQARVVPFVVQHEESGATRLCLTWEGAVEEFTLRRVSTGMAGNAALAIATALHLGTKIEAIRKRLPSWRPAALRGEVINRDGSTFYLDCYNANPASMLDALETFASIADPAEPRLYVVGCMEELGADTVALHRETGQRWPMRAGDRMVVFGTQADALADGVRVRLADADVLVNPDTAAAAAVLRDFHGAVFLKGSRRYALEKLINDVPGAHAHAGGHGTGERTVRAAC